MKKRILMTVGFVAVLAVVLAYGQPASIKAIIDFQFTAGGKVFPAGDYQFTRDTIAPVFRVQGEGKNFALAPVITRLAAAMHTTPQDSHLVFDKVGDTYMLSEIWVPGEDGYVLLITKGEHTHKVVNVKY